MVISRSGAEVSCGGFAVFSKKVNHTVFPVPGCTVKPQVAVCWSRRARVGQPGLPGVGRVGGVVSGSVTSMVSRRLPGSPWIVAVTGCCVPVWRTSFRASAAAFSDWAATGHAARTSCSGSVAGVGCALVPDFGVSEVGSGAGGGVAEACGARGGRSVDFLGRLPGVTVAHGTGRIGTTGPGSGGASCRDGRGSGPGITLGSGIRPGAGSSGFRRGGAGSCGASRAFGSFVVGMRSGMIFSAGGFSGSAGRWVVGATS
ncbi:hypothetical protein NRB20_75110 [Nocardia sp. RB20]|uniref:Uncharacterized protein n=1 Tax=Nocardia macrotermitis TaxID=2585198 RepID=A0A7K0DF14_9NOCA|nr:hypothetical protein [Nocardia macrotermitis]